MRYRLVMLGSWRRGSLAAALALLSALVPIEPAEAHDCGPPDANPSCTDFKDVVIRGGTQARTTKQLGHYCEDDKTILRSRIKAVWQDVEKTRKGVFGRLSTITVIFEGDVPFHLGALDAWSDKNYFHHRDHKERYGPGESVTFRIGKRVKFNGGFFVIGHRPYQAWGPGTPGDPTDITIACGGPDHQVRYEAVS